MLGKPWLLKGDVSYLLVAVLEGGSVCKLRVCFFSPIQQSNFTLHMEQAGASRNIHVCS